LPKLKKKLLIPILISNAMINFYAYGGDLEKKIRDFLNKYHVFEEKIMTFQKNKKIDNYSIEIKLKDDKIRITYTEYSDISIDALAYYNSEDNKAEIVIIGKEEKEEKENNKTIKEPNNFSILECEGEENIELTLNYIKNNGEKGKINLDFYSSVESLEKGIVITHEFIHYLFDKYGKKSDYIILDALMDEFLAYTFDLPFYSLYSQDHNLNRKENHKTDYKPINKEELKKTIKKLNELIVFYFFNTEATPVFPQIISSYDYKSEEEFLIDVIMEYLNGYSYYSISKPLKTFLYLNSLLAKENKLKKIKKLDLYSVYKKDISCYLKKKDKKLFNEKDICERLNEAFMMKSFIYEDEESNIFLDLREYANYLIDFPSPSCKTGLKYISLELYNKEDTTKIRFSFKKGLLNNIFLERDFKKNNLEYVLKNQHLLLEDLLKNWLSYIEKIKNEIY